MMAKPITAILAVALLLSASGTVGSIYFVSSQGQTTIEPAELTLSESEASPGSVIEVEGINFGANSQISIYFMSAEEADLTDGSAFVLQGIDANQSTTTTTEPEGTSAFFDADGDALHTLGNLLDTTSVSEHNLLVVLEERVPVNGTISLECEDENIAQGLINGTIGTFGASPGTYNECSISISDDDDIIDTGEIEELVVVSDSEEDYENSLVASETANEEGTFGSSVTVPNVEGGEYAILAVADDRRTAASALSVTAAESVTEPAVDTSADNATEGIIMNETITQTPEDEEELAEEEATGILTAEIISNSTEGVAPATFEFQANITGGTEPYAISWNFGDGSEESDEQTVLHTFEEAGIYNVVLTITDENGEEASDNLEITVNEPSPTIAEPLTVGIISNSTEGVAPATFEFQANLTGGTEPYTYLWDFDDGSEESDEQTVLHTFEEAGIYNVTLTATDTDDQEASDNLEITVNEPSPTIAEPLTAEIISNSTEGVAPATFEFQANLTGGTEPYTYLWDFGDGSEESDEQTVLHTFEEAGIYNVTLTATDIDNQDAFDSIEITVEEAPAEVVEEEGEATTTTVQNQTQNNQTDTAGEEEPTVQLDETSAEPGS